MSPTPVRPGQLWEIVNGDDRRLIEVVRIEGWHVLMRRQGERKITRARRMRFTGRGGGYRLVKEA